VTCSLSNRRNRSLGGIGTPKHEALAYVPVYAFPVYWVEPAEFAYYNGLELAAVDGEPPSRSHATSRASR
jgi:hypothetical protein